MLLIILIIALLALSLYKVTQNGSYWKEKEILYLKPWPVIGNMGPFVFRRRALLDLVNDLYNAFPNERYFGMHLFMQPTLFIRDPDLIKEITVKHFDTFPDHRAFISPDLDPLAGKNLFSMSSKDGWHDMRATLSPSFTSSKLKAMYVLMQQCAQQFVEYFQSQKGTISVELKDIFTRFTNDVIGTTAFGVTCNSLREPENEFYRMGKDAADFTGFRALRFFGSTVSPMLMKLLNVQLFSKEISRFFRGLIQDTVRLREQTGAIRPDMIHLLLEARKDLLRHTKQGSDFVSESDTGRIHQQNKPQLTDDDITAQAFIFFLAGFDSVSTLMCYTAYELAIHPNIQEHLHEEVKAVSKAGNGQIGYEALLGMKYLDQVISETLRKWPSFGFTDRKSVKSYTILGSPEGKPLHLNAGTLIWIPIYGIHMDPKYHPDPDKFDPERFSDANKRHMNPFTYLPFGVGPRNCIGSRFALIESKLIITELLREFEFVPTEKTSIPVKLSKANPSSIPDGGLWLGLKPRLTSL